MFKQVTVNILQVVLYYIGCKLFITNDVVVLHFVQGYLDTYSFSTNFLRPFFWQMKQNMNGTPSKEGGPGLVLIRTQLIILELISPVSHDSK